MSDLTRPLGASLIDCPPASRLGEFPSVPDLFGAVVSVWPADAGYQWCGELADALAERFPGEYPATAGELAEALRAAGVEVRLFARLLDGRPVVREGVSRVAFGVAWVVGLAGGIPPDAPVHTGVVTCAASAIEEANARRWLTDLTAGSIEHELTTEEVIAAVNALHPGGWPAFVADETGYFKVLALLDGADEHDDASGVEAGRRGGDPWLL